MIRFHKKSGLYNGIMTSIFHNPYQTSFASTFPYCNTLNVNLIKLITKNALLIYIIQLTWIFSRMATYINKNMRV